MKKFTKFLLERDEPRKLPDGSIDYPDRNSFAVTGDIPHTFPETSNTIKVYKNSKDGKIYKFVGTPELDGGEWWIKVAEVDSVDGKILKQQNEPILDFLPNLIIWK